MSTGCIITASELFLASLKKPRGRSKRMDERALFLINYADRYGPVTVRRLYYRAVVARLDGIEKTQGGYDKIQYLVLKLRRQEQLPYRDIADNTHWMRKPDTFNSVEQALQDTARLYRKSLWTDADTYIEVWCEK
jgi:hypothetical protein